MINIKIRKLRESYGFTQEQVANFINVERTSYSYYETGKSPPSLEVLVNLAKLFSVSCDYIIFENQENIILHIENCTEKEHKMIVSFRMLTTDKQNKVIGLM